MDGDPTASKTLRMHGNTSHANREIPGSPAGAESGGAQREVQGPTPLMHEAGKSDSPIRPKKVANKGRKRAAESLEERGLAERNSPQATTLRTQGRARVHEPEFAGVSYGARPRRSAHQALAALDRGLMTKPINWVLDADLRNFFGSLSQEHLVRFVEHRIGDKRVVRLIRRWLAAGVLEDGTWTRSEVGTEQGGSIP